MQVYYQTLDVLEAKAELIHSLRMGFQNKTNKQTLKMSGEKKKYGRKQTVIIFRSLNTG